MSPARARIIAKESFPMTLYGTYYKTFGALKRNDPIALDDLLDHIEYNEPIQS